MYERLCFQLSGDNRLRPTGLSSDPHHIHEQINKKKFTTEWKHNFLNECFLHNFVVKGSGFGVNYNNAIWLLVVR